MSIQELDLSSSYGYAASTMATPTGFCIGYTANNDGAVTAFADTIGISQQQEQQQQQLVCNEPNLRFQSFEFLSVYYLLFQLKQLESVDDPIHTVFSNFHQYGFLKIGSYPLDLAVVYKSGSLLMINIDGDYAHGCRQGCPTLPSYIRNKSRQELEAASEKRDVFLQTWCDNINKMTKKPYYAMYDVVTNCHTLAFRLKHLKSFFNQTPELLQLTDCYLTKTTITKDEVLFCNDRLTYVAIIEGHVPGDSPQLPLLVRDDVTKMWDRRSATLPNQSILCTKDYLTYLTRRHNFQVTKIHRVLFYKRCPILPRIFKDITLHRALSTTAAGRKQMLKNVVNYAAGFFGYNELKHATDATTGPSRLFVNVGRRATKSLLLDTQEAGTIGSTLFMMGKRVKRQTAVVTSVRKKTQSALPIFVSITEFGKLRLSQVFCFLEQHIRADHIAFLYSNVDNMVLALTADSLDDAVRPECKDSYLKYKSDYFTSCGQPGHVKQEFIFTSNQEWQFVSGLPQNYAILTNDVGQHLHKNSALSQVTSETSYNVSCAILDKQPIIVSQLRRTNKLLNTNVKVQQFTFK
jgi:hypothetical protein